MTESSCNPDHCAQCISHYVCTCMRVTDAELVEVIVSQGINDLRELRNETGAGDGCMACRQRLQRYLDEHAVRPTYRERVSAVALEIVACG